MQEVLTVTTTRDCNNRRRTFFTKTHINGGIVLDICIMDNSCFAIPPVKIVTKMMERKQLVFQVAIFRVNFVENVRISFTPTE